MPPTPSGDRISYEPSLAPEGSAIAASELYRLVSRISNDKRASVDRTDQIKSRMGASFKRGSGKFAANPSVLDYLRMPVAKEKPRLCGT